MKTYKVMVAREGKWWMIDVPEIGYVTQAHNLAEVEEVARSLVSGAVQTPTDSFEMDVRLDPAGLHQLLHSEEKASA